MPSAKKERSKNKKAAKRAGPPGLEAATARIKAANATPDLSNGLEAFLSIDLPGGQGAVTPAIDGASPEICAAATTTATTVAPDPVHLEIRAPKDLAEGDTQGMYDLVKGNMHDMYVEAGWGWDAAEKWREMEHRDARFLIARCRGSGGKEEVAGAAAAASVTAAGVSAAAVTPPKSKASCVADNGAESDADAIKATSVEVRAATVEGAESVASAGDSAVKVVEEAVLPAEEESEGGRLAGFCHFRFAWDEDENEDGEGVGGKEDVLYVYELQVAPWAKRRGLGRRMMQALELLANRHGMSKVMLTVFKENEQAMSFYMKKMKYGRDKDSPFNWDQPDAVYEILSKPTRQGAMRAKEALRAAALSR